MAHSHLHPSHQPAPSDRTISGALRQRRPAKHRSRRRRTMLPTRMATGCWATPRAPLIWLSSPSSMPRVQARVVERSQSPRTQSPPCLRRQLRRRALVMEPGAQSLPRLPGCRCLLRRCFCPQQRSFPPTSLPRTSLAPRASTPKIPPAPTPPSNQAFLCQTAPLTPCRACLSPTQSPLAVEATPSVAAARPNLSSHQQPLHRFRFPQPPLPHRK